MRFLIVFPFLALLPFPALSFPVEVRSCDRVLEFEEAPNAAVSNDINITEMMLALGLEEFMVGYTDIQEDSDVLPELRPQLSNLKELSNERANTEVLLAAGADFYFAGWNYGLTVGTEMSPEGLGRFGIAVYELTESCIHVASKDQASIEDMFSDLLNLGRIFGVEARAEKLVEEYRGKLELLRQGKVTGGNPIRAFVYDSGEDAPFTAGRYAMPTALIQAAGGENVFADFERSWATVGWESVIERNPEIVVIVDYGAVTAEQKWTFMKENPAFSEIAAVRQDRHVVLNYVEATPGPQNIGAIEKLANAFRSQ
ncbi:MAG: ABC transporter substrate-binding protein [Rhodobacteraceae bacterium]|nr:ABC transporter substrate-binding protein [Paracoccaceae bacterium]